MGKFIDLTGEKFCRLTVIEKDIEKTKQKKRTYWKCQCECGNITSVSVSDLRTGHTKSCGCLQKEAARKVGQTYGTENARNMGKKYGAENGRANFIDLAGKRFGKLTAINREESKGYPVYWNCICDCGNKTVVSGSHLRSGHTQSCGCLSSKGEYKIAQLLTLLDFDFEKEKIFVNLKGKANNLRFDFYLPEYNTCIEYQGAQHFHIIEHFGGESKFFL